MGVWCTVRELGPDGTTVAEWILRGCGTPTVEIVDDLAERQLAARRSGGRLRLTAVCEELAGLIGLAGLRDALIDDRPANGPPDR